MGRGVSELDELALALEGPRRDLATDPILTREKIGGERGADEDLAATAGDSEMSELGGICASELLRASTSTEISSATRMFSAWLSAAWGLPQIDSLGRLKPRSDAHLWRRLTGPENTLLRGVLLALYHDQDRRSAGQAGRALRRVLGQIELRVQLNGATPAQKMEAVSPWLGSPSDEELAEFFSVKPETVRRWKKGAHPSYQYERKLSEMYKTFYWIERELGVSAKEFRARAAEKKLPASRNPKELPLSEQMTRLSFWTDGVAEVILKEMKDG